MLLKCDQSCLMKNCWMSDRDKETHYTLTKYYHGGLLRLLMSKTKKNRQHMCSNSHQVSYYISSGETLPCTAFVNKLISLLSLCAPRPLSSVLLPHLAFWNQSLSCSVFFSLSLSVCVLSQCFSLSFFLSHTLSIFPPLSASLASFGWFLSILTTIWCWGKISMHLHV